VYTLDELRVLSDPAREHGLRFHIDDERLANAVASLDTDLRVVLVDTGVDVLTFGGTKNGKQFGEAIVFRARAPEAGLPP
jgi:threonine aldolase